MYTSLLFRVTDLTFDLKAVTLEDQYSIFTLYLSSSFAWQHTYHSTEGFFSNFYFSL